ncbi:hypothetical protein HGRIS_007929 [Hohenbuehelia grisea]|uniref:Zinc finger CHCC-type domain-containing protein n=1 Tax=Hohenbuehelia grisea TaxID=104357 RepID=A0ABR3J6Q9_9AGAR
MFGRRLVPQLKHSLRLVSRANSSSSAAKAAVPATSANTSLDAPQSPNYATTWSTNQRARPAAASGPRFEQTVMELQPNPLSAMELIANEPIRLVDGRKAVCDGGGGPLGHPKIYINLDQPGPRACGYWYVLHCYSPIPFRADHNAS